MRPVGHNRRHALRVTFLGTRGGIVARSKLHRVHSALLVSYRGQRVMIDCGADWAGRVGQLRLDAIVITHAHPDHAGGLRTGVPCPVYATRATWRGNVRQAVAERDRRVLVPGSMRRIAGIAFVAYPVKHSLLAPAIGLRVGDRGSAFFYVPDVASIPSASRALRDVTLYVGDGASIARGVLRGRGAQRIGHASIRTQLRWCARADVRRALFTHCGTEIVVGGHRAAERRVRELAREHGVEASIARDGLTLAPLASKPSRTRRLAAA